MRSETFTAAADDGLNLFVYRWEPDEGVPQRAVVHISHGMAEHAARYARLAEALTAAGYVVYANDHRGHGRTAKGQDELGFFAPRRGFQRVADDLQNLITLEKQRHPGLPVVLFGHSMGAAVAQVYMAEYGHELAAAVLSGGTGKPSPMAQAGRLMARVEMRRHGARGVSELLGKLSFGAFNKAFAPNRTEFDWLSRDAAEVDKYVADPLCGFPCSTQLWVDLLDAGAWLGKPSADERVPKGLPVYVFAGSEDPVSERTKGLVKLVEAYKKAGIRDVTSRFYPGGRHEMLNETNRDEVTRDLIAWLDARVGGR